jgi:predicted phage terminase large subunit-like protein
MLEFDEVIEARLNLAKFTERLGYVNGKHQKKLYQALQDESVKRLLVIWPPGHGKTTCGTINYPAWRVGNDHNLRFIECSHTQNFVDTFLRGVNSLMADQRYVDVFGQLKPAKPNKWAMNELIVNRTTLEKDSTFTALGVEASIVGRRADEIIVDDPIDETTANSETERDNLYRWYSKELLTRLEPNGRLMVIMTRWHFADIASKLLEDDSYLKLQFPAISPTNEALWPEKWPLDALLTRKKDVGPIAFEGQYQGRPIASEFAVLKIEWLHYWYEGAEQIPEKDIVRWHRKPPREQLRVVQAWDLAISQDPEADWTVGLSLGADMEGNTYLLDYYRAHIDFPAQLKQVEAQAAAWRPEKIAIESNAYQKALSQQLRVSGLPIVEVKQTRDKNLRIQSLAPYFENGSLRVSKGQEEFMLEYLQYPKGKHEDILDALQMAHSLLEQVGPVRTMHDFSTYK